MMSVVLSAFVFPLAFSGPGAPAENMNGEYAIGATPNGKPGLFPKHYREYPRGVESFDVYSPPMSTLYSQVWWQALDPVALPEEIVKRYSGSGMAIVGWEMDQVRTAPGGGDSSVPISALYLHHFTGSMIGAGARYRKVRLDGPDDPRAAQLKEQHGLHGMVAWDMPHYIVEPSGTQSDPKGRPSHQSFASANGGEYRKSYHGFAPGYALVVDSPTEFQITPMQIDTWHRAEMNISAPLPPKFVPGPLPRSSLAGANPLHSGLLECPMTTRLTKAVDGAYDVLSSGVCREPILTSHECFHAAAASLAGAGRRFSNASASDPSRPPGCSATVVAAKAQHTGEVFSVLFNSNSQAASHAIECGAGGARCLCPHAPKPFGQASGALVYTRTNQSADKGGGRADYFGARSGKVCAAWPGSSLLDQRNPTCDIRTYRGGQWACHHMWSLLDADQPIPWTDQPLTWRIKLRFWVQPYDEAFHTRLSLGETSGDRYPNAALLIGSPWEYDVPQCAPSVPGCARDASGMWVHTVTGNALGQKTFVALNNHCHAPACLSMAVYACSKGTPLGECDARVGRLICRTDPVYGGTSNPALSGTRFDEPGYIYIPDCFWGDALYGLEPPLDLEGVPLHIVKTANATLGHYGEMAGGQSWVF